MNQDLVITAADFSTYNLLFNNLFISNHMLTLTNAVLGEGHSLHLLTYYF